MTGKLISFEGSEGSGKSTQALLLLEYLKEKKQRVLLVREPGGVNISEAIREILLDVKNTAMTAECETLLYMAARAQLVEEVIKPALEKGTLVLCDRYLDSTLAYQGYGNGMDIDFIKQIGRVATQGIQPDLTFLFDIETDKGLYRAGRNKDRIEKRALAYHQRVRQGYLDLARGDPQRVKVIKVDKPKEEIFAVMRQYVEEILA